MESVGSIANFLRVTIFVLLTYFMRKQWTNSICREIMRKADKTNTKEKVLHNIWHRVSYKGIYQLHEEVSGIKKQMKDLMNQHESNEDMLDNIERQMEVNDQINHKMAKKNQEKA